MAELLNSFVQTWLSSTLKKGHSSLIRQQKSPHNVSFLRRLRSFAQTNLLYVLVHVWESKPDWIISPEAPCVGSSESSMIVASSPIICWAHLFILSLQQSHNEGCSTVRLFFEVLFWHKPVVLIVDSKSLLVALSKNSPHVSFFCAFLCCRQDGLLNSVELKKIYLEFINKFYSTKIPPLSRYIHQLDSCKFLHRLSTCFLA